MSGAVDITAFCCGQGREFRIYVVVPDELEETVFTQPIHYFTRRTLLQDSASEFHEMCLRTRIALLLQEKRPRLITEALNAIRIKLAKMDEEEAELNVKLVGGELSKEEAEAARKRLRASDPGSPAAEIQQRLPRATEREALLEQRRALLEEQAELPKGAAGTAPDRIMSVCSLAQAQQSPAGPWCTRSVFVHSKVLMVDDIYLVVGSANVNDRSFMGDRDSELGVLLTDDTDTVDSTMAGKSFRAGRTVRDYRLRTFRGFLGRADGTPDDDIIDPIESGFMEWTSVAKENRRLLTAVFMHTPRDDIKSFGQWSDLREGYFAAFELVKTLAKEPEGVEGYQDALKLVGKEYLGPIEQLEDHTTLVAVFLRHLKKELEQAEEVERLEDAKASFASVQGLATELLQQLVTEPEQLVATAEPRPRPEPEPEASRQSGAFNPALLDAANAAEATSADLITPQTVSVGARVRRNPLWNASWGDDSGKHPPMGAEGTVVGYLDDSGQPHGEGMEGSAAEGLKKLARVEWDEFRTGSSAEYRIGLNDEYWLSVVPPPPPRPGFRGCLCEYPREFLGDQASRSALETFMETFPPGLDTAL